jgi:polysaccharide biosynthesis transport protein
MTMSEEEFQRKLPLPQSSDSSSDDDGIDILAYVRILRRRWLLIVLSMVVVVGATAFITLRMTKIYRATTTVRIETQAPQVLGRSVEAVDEMGTGTFWSNIEYYETQYKIISSRDVANRVVTEFKLNEDMDFLQIPEEKRAEFEPLSVEAAAQRLQSITTVEPVKDSRLVLIHIDSPNPHSAQLYANAVANAYLDQNLESMLSSTIDAVDWLSKQLDDAQEELSDSEEKIYEYMKGNDILSVSLEERQNILTAQMMAAATKLTEARAKRIEIGARKAAIATVVTTSDPMSIPLDSLNSSTLIQELKTQYGKLSQEYDELSERYGENFPRMIELKAKLDRIGSDISREVRNILVAVDAELAAARATEIGLQKTLDEFRSQALSLAEKAVGFNKLTRVRTTNEQVYQLLTGRSKEADLSRLLRVNNVHILDSALLPKVSIKPRLHINLLVALVIGLMLGLGLAMLLEFADRTLKTQEDVEALGVAFLGIVPSIDSSSVTSGKYSQNVYGKGKQRKRRSKQRKPVLEPDGTAPINYDLFVNDYPKSQVAESLRAIRTNLLFMSADKTARRILVTSPSPQEGKTTVAVNMAIVMAHSGSKVLLVDTDMRRPRVHHAFNIRPKLGMSTMVLGESSMEESVFHSAVPNLDVLMCGPTPPNPAELMLTEAFVKVIDKLSQNYDRVIFDSPPVAVVTDAAILSKLVDGTVLILKSLQTTRDAARHAVGTLNDIDANILGAVLNDLDLKNKKYGQHYYYYYKKYGYYYHSDEEESESPADDNSNRPAAV